MPLSLLADSITGKSRLSQYIVVPANTILVFSASNMNKPSYFRVKKYLLLVLIFSTMAIYIFYILNFAGKMNNEETEQHSDALKGDFKPLSTTYTIGRTAILALFAIFGFFILFQLLGLMGVLREYFCISCIYVILQFAITVVDFILITFYGSALWGAACWSLFILIIALVYLRDLYLIYVTREQQQQQQRQQVESGDIAVISGSNNCPVEDEVFQ